MFSALETFVIIALYKSTFTVLYATSPSVTIAPTALDPSAFSARKLRAPTALVGALPTSPHAAAAAAATTSLLL